ncbi:hypothetical protein Cni_G00931 [Canna indica]|uniref:Ternary complex factor MIP1 n=1 Tax=Canna indica TaxID=4628 RepID=A0AAQ3JP40_9LILI|nr:hypothetical protein Cni_G00931 [Canna indica]
MVKFPMEAMDSIDAVSATHKRSKSDSEKRTKNDKLDTSVKSFNHNMEEDDQAENEMRKRPSPNYEVESSLKKEIQKLEKCLKDQFIVRRALEKTLRHNSSSIDASIDSYIPKPAKKLIREIAMLELEVVHLEQYLLSLYRRAFKQQIPSVSPRAVDDLKKQPLIPKSAPFPGAASHNVSFRKVASTVQLSHIIHPQKSANNLLGEAFPIGSQEKHGRGIHRSHSSLVPHSVCSAKGSSSVKNHTRPLKQCHTLPLSFLEHEQSFSSRITSLADHLGTTIADHIPETPNRLSEDMIRFMCAIYCRHRDYHVGHHGVASSSPTSSFSSRTTFSPCYTGELRSPCYKRDAILDSWFENSRCSERLKEFSGPYNVMVEVSSICKASRRRTDVEEMLHKYKLLLKRLETVDPRNMSTEEKIAFWINIHNAMMMHAHLEYGVPGSYIKRVSLLTKNMYKIGSRMVNAEIIQESILGCRMHPSGQWLRALLSSKTKIKDSDEWKSYAIENSEPLIRFALCSGSHSDPAVRVYSSKRLFPLLEAAKMEYLQATVTFRKGQKILLPKMVDLFAKDSNLSAQELLDMIKCHLPESLRSMMNGCQARSSDKMMEWVPHNFTFRYLLPRELGSLKLN